MMITRPANMFSVRRVCQENQMRYPRPYFAATNSAAMMTIRAVPRLRRSPAKMIGRAPGMMMWINICRRLAP